MLSFRFRAKAVNDCQKVTFVDASRKLSDILIAIWFILLVVVTLSLPITSLLPRSGRFFLAISVKLCLEMSGS